MKKDDAKLDIYFNEAYGKLYENIESGTCTAFVYESAHGKVKCIFIKKPVPWLVEGKQYYDVVTPYGYGGPLILESDDVDALIGEYTDAWQNYCAKSYIIAEFVRFHLFDNTDVRSRYYGDVAEISNNVVIDTKRTENEIWMSYEHKVRKNVNKAIRHNLSVEIDLTGERLCDFLSIYYKTMERNQAIDYFYLKKEFFEQIKKNLDGQYGFFHVIKDDIVISTELVLFSDTYVYSFLGGTNEQYYEYRPNDILKHEIIKWCVASGKSAFILGGGYHKNDGIYRYKKSFAPDGDVPFFVGKKIWNQNIYDQLCEMHSRDGFDLSSTDYFPAYRA